MHSYSSCAHFREEPLPLESVISVIAFIFKGEITPYPFHKEKKHYFILHPPHIIFLQIKLIEKLM